MTTFKSEFVATLVARGFMHQCTDLEALDELAANQRITAYIGYDCTAPSLHVGSLVQIMTQRHLQNTGHQPIVLMGGGTTKVGDPSGKDAARQLLSDDDSTRTWPAFAKSSPASSVLAREKTTRSWSTTMIG
jgi:tyrosyl-tRNA synthetase